MNKSEIIKLPFWEVLKRTFVYVWKDKKMMLTVLPMLAALIAAQFILQWLIPCDNALGDCSKSWQNITIMSVFLLVNIGFIINYCRRVVLQANPNFTSLKFWKAIVFYGLSMIVFCIVLAFPLLVLAPVVAIISFYLNNLGGINWEFPLVYLLLIIELILVAPLLLWFACISVEDYGMMSIKKLFRLAKGNHNRLFWGLIASTIPLFVLLVAVMLIWSAFWGIESLHDNLGFWAVSVVVQALNSCIKGSYYGHTYQFFKFIEKKEKN